MLTQAYAALPARTKDVLFALALVVGLAALVVVRSWPLPVVMGDALVGAHHPEDALLHAQHLQLLGEQLFTPQRWDGPTLFPHALSLAFTEQLALYAPLARLLRGPTGSDLAAYQVLLLLVQMLNGLAAFWCFRRFADRGPAVLGMVAVVLGPWTTLHLPRLQLLSLWPIFLGLGILLDRRTTGVRMAAGLTAAAVLAWSTCLYLASFACPGFAIAGLLVARSRMRGELALAAVGGVGLGTALVWPVLRGHQLVREAYAFADLEPLLDLVALGPFPLVQTSSRLSAVWSFNDTVNLDRALFPGAILLVLGSVALVGRLLWRLDVHLQPDALLVTPTGLLRAVAVGVALLIGASQLNVAAFGLGIMLLCLLGPLLKPPTSPGALAADVFCLMAICGALFALGNLFVLGDHQVRTPFFWLRTLGAPFDGIRAPHRFGLFATLAFTGLVVLVAHHLPLRAFARRRAWAALGALLIVDLLPQPQPVDDLIAPEVMAPSIVELKGRDDRGAVLHLPYRSIDRMHGQSVFRVEAERGSWVRWHGHPTLNGHSGFHPVVARALLPELLERPSTAIVPGLRALGARYLHLELSRLPAAARQRWGSWAVNEDGVELLMESPRDLLLEISEAPHRPPASSLSTNSPALPFGCWLAEKKGFVRAHSRTAPVAFATSGAMTGASLDIRCREPVTFSALHFLLEDHDDMARGLTILKIDTGGAPRVHQVLSDVVPWRHLVTPGAGRVHSVSIVPVSASHLRVVQSATSKAVWRFDRLGVSTK